MNGWRLALAALLVLGLVSLFLPPHPQVKVGGPVDTGDTAWMLASTALVLLMTPGLSFFYGGMVRTKSVVSTMLQSFVAMGVVSILWVVVGFSLAFGESLGGPARGLVGNPVTYLGPDGKQYVAVYSGVGGWMGAVAFPSVSADDPYAALGVVGAMTDIKKKTAPGDVVYVFGF